ncbi:Rv1733c family protein [Cryptosporangium aurantiacum]|uniref:Transmembrane protein n=1 Tax=Cryptosporangium aurantiacum TaxID=134849 RepID=A0A1M7TYW0_9ACTN|nr:hypothetical protein [Cryptosporangium aurantiacum]SHN75909.1 hypothetical protein SAMN05443668_107412 [Cryptosporangium aurantiacum]
MPKYTLIRRAARLLGWTRNPLCRPVDRAEGALRVAAGLAVVLTLALAIGAGAVRYERETADAVAARSVLLHVPVELRADTPSARTDAIGPGVVATWTLPDGTVRTGRVYTGEIAADGDTVTVWMDASYEAVHPPATDAELLQRAVLGAVLTFLLVLAGLAGAYRIARRRLDRHRDAAWTRDWLVAWQSWHDRSL